MAYDPTNVPSWLDIDLEIDLSGDNDFTVATDLKPGLTQMQGSGGGHEVGEVGTADGSTFTGVGRKLATRRTFRMVYTDGESPDDWATIKAAEGGKVAARYSPKGGVTGDRRHIITGVLERVDDPIVENQKWVYDVVVYGMTSSDTVPT